MDKHVRNLAISTIAAGIVGLLAAIGILYFGGGKSGLLHITYEEKLAGSATLNTMPITGLVLFGVSIYLILITAPLIATGVGLYKFQPWARWVGIALHGLNLLCIPVGTILGLYAIWVLMSEETEPLFEERPYYRN